MTTTAELIEGIVQLLGQMSSVPVMLANHDPELARLIITDVVERGSASGISVSMIEMDPAFAREIGFDDGAEVISGLPTKVHYEDNRGRQLILKIRAQ